MLKRVFLLLTLCLNCVFSASALANVDRLDPAQAYGDQAIYRIDRNGKEIGQHTLSFSTEGRELKVEVQSDIKVTFLKIPVYRLKYNSEERWINGELERVNSTVVENDAERDFVYQFADQSGILNSTGTSTGTSTDITNTDPSTSGNGAARFASNHWNADVLKEKYIFNTLTGNTNQVDIVYKGTEKIELVENDIEARRYQYTGDLSTEVWYDAHDRWVKLQFRSDDGSIISYTTEGFANEAAPQDQ